MKKFLVEILILVVLVIATVMTVERFYRDYPTVFNVTFNRYEKYKDDITQINIGASHIGILGRAALSDTDNAFNLSFGGQDLFHIMTVLQKACEDAPKLKTIILGLDYNLIGYNFAMENQEWKDRQYYPYTGKLYKDNLKNRFLGNSNFFIANRDISYFWKRKDRLAIFAEPPPDHTSEDALLKAMVPLENKDFSERSCEARANELSNLFFNPELINENLSYLDSIITLTSDLDIELCIVNTPKSKCYRKYYNIETLKLCRVKIREILDRRGIKYFDYFDDDSFELVDFGNPDHLNPIGARKLMECLKKELSESTGIQNH